MEYEVVPQVDEFCRVDGAEFNFSHIPCLEQSSASGISELYHDEEHASPSRRKYVVNPLMDWFYWSIYLF